VQLSLTTLELEEGISLSIILTDLTSQKETQRQLLRNNEKLEEANKALESSNHDLQQFASVARTTCRNRCERSRYTPTFLRTSKPNLRPNRAKIPVEDHRFFRKNEKPDH